MIEKINDTKLYYLAHENRYQKVFEVGSKCWGHSPNDDILIKALLKWVSDDKLKANKIIEFACGEWLYGVILSKLGWVYYSDCSVGSWKGKLVSERIPRRNRIAS